LRFSRADVGGFLNGVLGLGLSGDLLDRLHESTDGQPAGVRLLAGVPDGPLPPSGTEPAFEFLAEAVFMAQPAPVRRFLVETSALTTVTGPVCASLTGRADAGVLLEELARRGLFLTEYRENSGATSYRYHPLFAEFLARQRSGWPESSRAELHRRAATAEPDPLAVIGHIVAAGEPERAADLLERDGPALLARGRVGSLRELVAGVPAKLTAARPSLLVLHGDLAFAAGDLSAARHMFERALTMLAGEADRGSVCGKLADCLYLQGQAEDGDRLLDRALAAPMDPLPRVRLLLSRARIARIRQRPADAGEAFAEAVELAVGGDPEVVAAVVAAATTHVVPGVCLIRGGVDQLERLADTAQRVLPAKAGPARLHADGAAVAVDCLRGRFDDIVPRAGGILREYERFGGAPPLFGYAMAGFAVLAANARDAPLDELLAELEPRANALVRDTFLYAISWFVIGRAQWLAENLVAAREAHEKMREALAPPGSASIIKVHALSLDGLLALSEGDHRRAETLLREAIDEEERVPLVDIYGSARIRLAYLYTTRGRTEAALRIAAPALRSCQEQQLAGRILFEGRVSVPVLRLASGTRFASFTDPLLRRLDVPVPPRAIVVPATGQTLTAREAEVLELLAAGATNRQIAHKLVVGEETIKTHVTRILRKLDVPTRTAAAARAHRLGLRPDGDPPAQPG
jgi:LuxR family maltose regulon positive regulatory protein